MHAIRIETVFCASHQLRLPGGGLEPLHGHNWQVTVTVESPTLDALETVMDFHQLQEDLAAIVQPWNNKHLNAIEPFASTINPTAERVAERIAELMKEELEAPVELAEVTVSEAPGCVAIWRR